MPRPRKEYVTLLRYAKPGFGIEYESAKVKFEKEWLSDYVQREFNMTLDDFLNEYTWDVVDPIERAYKEYKAKQKSKRGKKS